MIFRIMFRTTFFYFFIIFSYKLMGKREVGELDIIDFVMSMLLVLKIIKNHFYMLLFQ